MTLVPEVGKLNKEARESNIIWRELKHRRNFSLGGTTGGGGGGGIKLVAFAENSKHNSGQNKGQNFRGFQGSKWNYKLDYTLWVPLIIIRIMHLIGRHASVKEKKSGSIIGTWFPFMSTVCLCAYKPTKVLSWCFGIGLSMLTVRNWQNCL